MGRSGHGLASLLLVLAAQHAQAGGWQVVALAVGGEDASAKPVRVETARDCFSRYEPRDLRLHEKLEDLTCLRVARDVYLELRSEQDVHALHDYGGPAQLELTQSTPNRNSLAVKAGEWLIRVTRPLSVVSVSAGRRAEGLTRGTVFQVALDGEDEATQSARFLVRQGHIAVTSELAIEVAGAPPMRAQQRRILGAGDGELRVPPPTADAHLRRYGSYGEAIEAFEAAARQAAGRHDDDGRFNALVALGDVLLAMGRGADAAARFEAAAALVPDPRDAYWRAVLHGRSGSALRSQNRLREAAQAYRRSIVEHAGVPFAEGMDPVTDQRGNLAGVADVDGTYGCALQLAGQVLQALDARAATRNSDTRIGMLQLQGDVALGRGQAARALALYEQAYDLAKRYVPQGRDLPADTSTLAVIEARLGQAGALYTARRHDEALALYQLAERNVRVLVPGPSSLLATAQLGQALVAAARGRTQQALAAADGIVAMLAQAPFDALTLGSVQQSRGDWLLALGRRAEALDAYGQARALWEQIWPDDGHPNFFTLLPAYAAALRRGGTPAEQTQARELDRALAEGRQALAARDAACQRGS